MKTLMLLVLFLALVNHGTEAIRRTHRVQNNIKTKYYNIYNGGVGGKNVQLLIKLIKLLIAKLKSNTNHPKCPGKYVPKNCLEILRKSRVKKSGVYDINPDCKGKFKVYCDQKTAGGGWTVFQKRKDGSVNFYRGWAAYKNGFGNLNGEFWLGLDKIYRLTHKTRNRLRVDLMDTKMNTAYAEYSYFAVENEGKNYRLRLGKYSGTAGDSLSLHRNYAFSTKDKDNDGWSKGSCSVRYKGAWWYKECHRSNLNGLYHHGKHRSSADGVNWWSWKGHHYSVKRAEMKIRS